MEKKYQIRLMNWQRATLFDSVVCQRNWEDYVGKYFSKKKSPGNYLIWHVIRNIKENCGEVYETY